MRSLTAAGAGPLGFYAFLDCVDAHMQSLLTASDAIVRDGNVWRNVASRSYAGVSLIVDGSAGDVDIGLAFFDRSDRSMFETGRAFSRTQLGASRLARDIYALITTFF